MSLSESSDSESGSPAPEFAIPDAPSSLETVASPLAANSSTSPPQPCQYQPSCTDQCPAFAASESNALRCICGHLRSLHRCLSSGSSLETTPSTGPPPSTALPTPVPPSKQPRWINRVQSLKRVAQAEVKSGYLTRNKGKGRAVSSPVVARSTTSTSSTRQAGKSTDAVEEPKGELVRAIYFIDYAHEGMTTVCIVVISDFISSHWLTGLNIEDNRQQRPTSISVFRSSGTYQG